MVCGAVGGALIGRLGSMAAETRTLGPGVQVSTQTLLGP